MSAVNFSHRNALSRGFSLIELLVVIAIIAILAAIMIVNLASVHKKGNDAKRLEDLKQIANELTVLNVSGVSALSGCIGAQNNNLTTDCNGPVAVLNEYLDPKGSSECLSASDGGPSTAPCQYTIGTATGGMRSAPAKTDNWEVCAYLETGGGPIGAPGLVSITSNSDTITAGCN